MNRTPVNSNTAAPLQQMPVGTRYYWFLVFYLVLISALGSFVNDMFTPALPSICRFFGCSASTGQLGLTFGMVGLAIGQLILGPVSDHYGRKPVLAYSVLTFIVGAIAILFSRSITAFIICRLLQGLGASGAYFLARTVPADIFQGRALAKLMALVGAINGIAPASAPVLGGVIADAFTWKGIFITLAIYAAVVLCFIPFFKESLPKSERTSVPWYKTFPGYVRLLKNRAFMTHVCLKGFALGLLFAYISSSPFILEDHYGFSQTMYGVIIGVNAILLVIGSLVALKFRPFKTAVAVGSFILIPSVGFQAYALWNIHSFWVFEACALPMLFAMGMIFSVSNTLAMNEGRAQAGEASAILGVAGYVVGGVVSPLVGIGNTFHSTAITFLALLVCILLCAWGTHKIAPDLDTDPAAGQQSATAPQSEP